MAKPNTPDQNASPPTERGMYDAYDHRRYGSLVRLLKRDSKAWLTTDHLMTALVANSREPIPQIVLEHLRGRLDGTVRKRQGRKKKADAKSLLRDLLVPINYERYLAWLQKRDHSQGLVGWKCIKGAAWWQGPPNERAARMVQASLMKNVDWRHVMNLVSKSRS